MKFEIETSAFTAALKALLRVAQSDWVTIVADKHLTLQTSSAGASIHLNVEDSKIKEKGVCTVPCATLEGVLKKRKTVSFEKHKDTLKFKAGKAAAYAGSLTLLPVQEVNIEEENTDIKLDENQLENLIEIVDGVSLLSVNMKKQDILPVCIRINSKGMEASCASRNHMAYAKCSSISSKTEKDFAILPTILPLIASVSNKSKYKLGITPTGVFASNKNFTVKFVTQQLDRFVKLESVKDFLKARSEPEASIKMKADSLHTVFQNMISLYETNSFIQFSLEDSTLQLSTKTKFGSASEKLEGKIKGSLKKPYSVHPKVFENLLSKCKSNSILIGMHDKKSVSLEQERNDVMYKYSCAVSGV